MCTPMTWHMRWRSSCFSPSRLPLGDHESTKTSSEVRKEIVCDKKIDNNRVIKPIDNKNFSPSSEKCNKEVHLMNKGKEGALEVCDNIEDSFRTVFSSADQEYIVFSFREDGSFDVVIDRNNSAKSESFTSVDEQHENARPVSRKLDYGEDAEQVKDQPIEKNISNANQQDNQHDQVSMTSFKEDEAKETINLSRTQHKDNIIRSCQTKEIADHRLVSFDSRNSNQSEGSRGSFAFPELSWELMGSPVKMPKSEDLHMKKQKIRCVRFQCWKF